MSSSTHTWGPRETPYGTTVPARLATHVFDLAPETFAHADAATVALSRFDATANHSTARVVTHLEAVASSQLEGIAAPAADVAFAHSKPPDNPDAAFVAANVDALAYVRSQDARDPLDDISAIHRRIMAPDPAHTPGVPRTRQAWVGGVFSTPVTAAFVPPHPDDVPASLHDWSAFVTDADLPALVHAAIAHAQFETIHPYSDGNGRTGRAHVASMLRAAGVSVTAPAPVSLGLVLDRPRYIEALIAFRDGDANPVVTVLAEALIDGTRRASAILTDVDLLVAGWESSTTARANSAARRLIRLLPSNPVVSAVCVQRLLGVSAPAAGRAVHHLEAEGVLSRLSTGSRNIRWGATDILDLL